MNGNDVAISTFNCDLNCNYIMMVVVALHLGDTGFNHKCISYGSKALYAVIVSISCSCHDFLERGGMTYLDLVNY